MMLMAFSGQLWDSRQKGAAMRAFFSFVVVSVLVCGIAAAEQAEQAEPVSQEQILQELRQLRQEVAELKRTVEALQARLDGRDESTEPSVPEWLWPPGFEGSGVDHQALSRVKLPENPTEAEVREYVSRVLAASEGQRTFSSADPQVLMLALVGPEHVDALVRAANWTPMADVHIVPAIRRLAGAEHKDLILDALPRLPQLVRVVLDRGWLHDARDTLVEGLRQHPDYLPTEWVEAVASFRDPDTYEELKQYLVHGTNRAHTYRAIKDLPGIKLSDSVAEAWRRASHSEWEATSMAPIAMEYGHLDALAYAVRTLTDPSPSEQRRYDNWRLWGPVGRHTDAPRSAEGLKSWFAQNEDRLVFDPETKMFRVKEGE